MYGFEGGAAPLRRLDTKTALGRSCSTSVAQRGRLVRCQSSAARHDDRRTATPPSGRPLTIASVIPFELLSLNSSSSMIERRRPQSSIEVDEVGAGVRVGDDETARSA